MFALSSVCQDSEKMLCVERQVLERVATKLDSFDMLKQLQPYYIKRYKSCIDMVDTQNEILDIQKGIIKNKSSQILTLEKIELEHKNNIEVNTKYIQELTKQNRKQKTINKITLAGGGVLTLGLTAALLVSLFQ